MCVCAYACVHVTAHSVYIAFSGVCVCVFFPRESENDLRKVFFTVCYFPDSELTTHHINFC